MKSKLFMGLFIVSLASCTGDYDCVCTNGQGQTEVANTYENVKKSDAKESCQAFQDLAIVFDPSASCVIEKK